jgi:hypothetical protein
MRNENAFAINLALAWLWIVLGFVGGFLLGLKFHREDWLGGYGGFKRRLYRLGHISLFGLAIINLLFYFTARSLGFGGTVSAVASCGFVIGAVSMPICCLVMAHYPRLRLLFLVPVLSLIVGGLSTLWEVIKL